MSKAEFQTWIKSGSVSESRPKCIKSLKILPNLNLAVLTATPPPITVQLLVIPGDVNIIQQSPSLAMTVQSKLSDCYGITRTTQE